MKKITKYFIFLFFIIIFISIIPFFSKPKETLPTYVYKDVPFLLKNKLATSIISGKNYIEISNSELSLITNEYLKKRVKVKNKYVKVEKIWGISRKNELLLVVKEKVFNIIPLYISFYLKLKSHYGFFYFRLSSVKIGLYKLNSKKIIKEINKKLFKNKIRRKYTIDTDQYTIYLYIEKVVFEESKVKIFTKVKIE